MNSFMLLSSASALGLPVVHAKDAATTSAEAVNDSSRKVKVSSIPLYPEPENWEFSAKPTSWLEGVVKDTRVQATNIKAEYQPVLDKASHIVDTGKAHTNGALAQLRAEGNIASQMGAIAFGGILGLVAARRRGFFKKFTYFFVGVGGASSLCYPEQAKILAGNAGNLALKNARIAYHFVIGARPNVQNENGKPFERTLDMASDIGKSILGLFEKGKSKKADHEDSQVKDLKHEAKESVIVEDAVASSDEVSAQPIIKNPEILKAKAVEAADPEGAPSLEVSSESPNDSSASFPPEIPIDSSTSSSVEPSSTDNVSQEEELPVPDLINEANEKASEEEKLGTQTGQEIASKPSATYEDLGQGTPEDKELYTTRE